MFNLFVKVNRVIVGVWKFINEAIDWRELSGILLILAGVLVGIYVGIWVCFIGGIIALVEAFKADPIVASTVAYACARIFFSSVIGWLSALVFIYPGKSLLDL